MVTIVALFFILVSACAFSGCSSDDTDEETTYTNEKITEKMTPAGFETVLKAIPSNANIFNFMDYTNGGTKEHLTSYQQLASDTIEMNSLTMIMAPGYKASYIVEGGRELNLVISEAGNKATRQLQYNGIEIMEYELLSGIDFGIPGIFNFAANIDNFGILSQRENGIKDIIDTIQGATPSANDDEDIRDIIDRLTVGMSVFCSKDAFGRSIVGTSASKKAEDTLAMMSVWKFESSEMAQNALDQWEEDPETPEGTYIQDGVFIIGTGEVSASDFFDEDQRAL